MNWELLVALGGTGAGLVMGFLYARARVQDAQAANLKVIADNLLAATKAQREVIADKEEYIRDLEKTVIGSLPAGQLANRLSLLFSSVRSREASAVLPAGRPAKATRP